MNGVREQEGPRPVIVAVDDDPEDLRRVEFELGKRYEADYRVACEHSAGHGMRKLRELKAAGEDVAIVIAAQRMTEMSGVEFLSHARDVHPVAKRMLLIDPMDRETGI